MKQKTMFLLAMLFAMLAWGQGPRLNEGFEGSQFPPEGWERINVVEPWTQWSRTTNQSHTGNASAMADFSFGTAENYLITPKLVVAEDDSISFWAIMDELDGFYNETYIKVYVSTTGNTVSSFTGNPILDISASYTGDFQITDQWKRWAVSLSDFIGQEIYIAFRHIDNGGYAVFIDDIEGPSLYADNCQKPSLLSAFDITTNSASISWTEGSEDDDSWWIYHRETGSNAWDSALTSNNPYIITSLSPNTEYEVVIKTNCGDEVSEPSVELYFRTSCIAVSTIPWTENFDNYTGSSRPHCWSFPVLYNDYPALTTVQSVSPSSSLRFETQSGGYTYAITPEFEEGINNLQISFMLKAENILNSGIIQVGVMSSNTDTNTFELVEEIIPSRP